MQNSSSKNRPYIASLLEPFLEPWIVSVLGHRLQATVYKYINVLFPKDCAAHCFREFCCRSANFRNIPVSDGRENCELLHAIAEEEPVKLRRKVIYDYLVVGRGEVSEVLKRKYNFCSNTRRFAKLNVLISFIPKVGIIYGLNKESYIFLRFIV